MNPLSEWTLQAISIAYDSALAAYVVPAVGVAVLSSMSFLISVVRQWWLLRKQEALLAEEGVAREEDLVGDSPEVRWLFFRVGSCPEVQSVLQPSWSFCNVGLLHLTTVTSCFSLELLCKGDSCTGAYGE